MYKLLLISGVFFFCSYYLCVAGQALSGAYFGAGADPIFLDVVQCTSGDTSLLGCTANPLLSHNCDHSNDAGVRCEGI